VTGGAEAASLAGEGEKNLMITVSTLDPRKAVFQIFTTQEFIDHLSDDVSQGSESLLISFLIDRLEFREVVLNRLIQRGGFRLPWLVDRLDHPVFAPGGSTTAKTLSDESRAQTRKPDSPR
jgi:hypothetical protein